MIKLRVLFLTLYFSNMDEYHFKRVMNIMSGLNAKILIYSRISLSNFSFHGKVWVQVACSN